eukprot:scaffold44984_cov28-Tisochrysis_lutea.AAC.3
MLWTCELFARRNVWSLARNGLAWAGELLLVGNNIGLRPRSSPGVDATRGRAETECETRRSRLPKASFRCDAGDLDGVIDTGTLLWGAVCGRAGRRSRAAAAMIVAR